MRFSCRGQDSDGIRYGAHLPQAGQMALIEFRAWVV